jgi:protein gp37
LEQPLHWKKPRRIFVNSLSDFFHENVPAAFIDQMLEVMAACPQHIFQVLTKRPENMHRKLYEITSEHPVRFFGGGDYLPNVWWGVSAEDQEMADTRIPPLLSIPAAVHWVSAEPLLDELDLRPYLQQLEWVVVGGESAPRGYARWCDPTWIWQIIHQCRVARVAVFVKQLGNYIAGCRNYQHPKGGAIEEWPRGLQVREYPQR